MRKESSTVKPVLLVHENIAADSFVSRFGWGDVQAWAGGNASAFLKWPSSLPDTVELCALQLPGRMRWAGRFWVLCELSSPAVCYFTLVRLRLSSAARRTPGTRYYWYTGMIHPDYHLVL